MKRTAQQVRNNIEVRAERMNGMHRRIDQLKDTIHYEWQETMKLMSELEELEKEGDRSE